MLGYRASSNLMDVTAGRPKHCVSDMFAARMNAEDSCHTSRQLGLRGWCQFALYVVIPRGNR